MFYELFYKIYEVRSKSALLMLSSDFDDVLVFQQ